MVDGRWPTACRAKGAESKVRLLSGVEGGAGGRLLPPALAFWVFLTFFQKNVDKLPEIEYLCLVKSTVF